MTYPCSLNNLILFRLLQYFRMELMHAEKQRKEKKEFEQAKMDLVGQLSFIKSYCLLVYQMFERVFSRHLY